jgi:hypothetical protein
MCVTRERGREREREKEARADFTTQELKKEGKDGRKEGSD